MASHSHREGHQQSHDHEHGHSHAEEDMLSVEEAFQRIMASFSPLEAEEVSLLDCLGQTEQGKQLVFILLVVWLDLIRERFFLTTKVLDICRCISVLI